MDQAGPKRDLPEHQGDADREAERRPERMSAPSFAEVALKLLDQGYEPLPILPGQKRPAITGWTSIRIDEAPVEAWCRDFGHCSVGLRTGHLVGVDIDILDADLAHQAAAIVNARLGPALLRVGRWPKRLLLYRTETPFAKFNVGKVEVLARGQQFVAFGIHPDTGRPYDWPMGESPLNVALDALPLVNEAMVEALLAELQPVAGAGPTGSRRSGAAQGGDGQTRDVDGLVTDGRDGWLSIIAFHAVHDAIGRGEDPDEVTLDKIVWARFANTTDLSRPRQNGRQAYGLPDALRKVRDKIRLHRAGRLPERSKIAVVPDYAPPSLDVNAARQELDRHLASAMAKTEAWHRQGGLEAAPRIGVRATVGLGKSTAARREVQAAQVVVAAYDAMFTGFAGDKQDLGLILIDEACWPRSFEADGGLTIEALPSLGIVGTRTSRRQDAEGADLADVVAIRQKLSAALASLGGGEVTRDALTSCGLDAELCQSAIASEYDALPAPRLSPGQGPADRRIAVERSLRRALGLQVIGLWSALADLLGGETTAVAKVWLGGMGKDGQRPIRIWRRKPMAKELTRLPLLHLDATLRAELASTVLPGLDCVTVEAHAAHQHIRLISGNFGKGNLCPDPRQGAAENRRRASRLQECVDYVRWHAQRHASGRILVITYLAIEAAFATIPGVETAHYNAVAGLDGWGDISALFLIGRPLPSSGDLGEMTGALFDRPVQGDYAARNVGLVLENGRVSGIRATRHTDASAEILRAAICDDEVMQALGRGRGVNRAADNPLEVHLMADVVLPVSYNRVQAWSIVCPDIVQRMLLEGVAVDSPGDAAKLHPSLFASPNAADCAFRREAFNRQNPIGDIYREMTVKSASYRLGGRGRGWQTAFWITGSADHARSQLERAIGPIVEWHCES